MYRDFFKCTRINFNYPECHSTNISFKKIFIYINVILSGSYLLISLKTEKHCQSLNI